MVYNFLNTTPISEQLREKIDKWDCLKLKRLLYSKEALHRMGKYLCQLYI
jgi:hypothetical protein